MNLAASTLPDDELERTIASFGGPEYGSSGFGTSEVLQELLSRDPKYVPIKDLKHRQEQLIGMGYAPPGMVADGVWSPAWFAPERRADRDSMDLIRAGKHFASTSTKRFFEYLGHTTTTGLMKGIFGMAEGIVEDFNRTVTNPREVFEEGGLLGGIAVGAGGGAIVGSVVPVVGTAVGAVVGGIGGGVAGFFGDLFDDDEDEEGNWEKFWGALTPFDEIKSGDAKNLFAAGSTVMTASAILKSGALGAKALFGVPARGARPGVLGLPGRGAREAVPSIMQSTNLAPAAAGRTIADAGFRNAFRMAGRGTVPDTIVSKTLSAAARNPVVGGALVGGTIDAVPELVQGDFAGAAGEFIRGAAVGAATGRLGRAAGIDQRALKLMELAPLRRMSMSGAGQVARAVYTPLSTLGVAGHLAGEFPGTGIQKALKVTVSQFQGWDERKQREFLEANPGAAEALQKGESVSVAHDFGTVGDVLDIATGAVLYPERLFPWRLRDAATAMKAMSSSNLLAPFAQAGRRVVDPTTKAVRSLSTKQAADNARELLGRTPDGDFSPALAGANAAGIHLSYGLERAAQRAVTDAVHAGKYKIPDDPAGAFFQSKVSEERSKIVAKIFRESGGEGVDPTDVSTMVRKSETGRRILQDAIDNPSGMVNFLNTFEGRNSSLENLLEHRQAEAVLQRAARHVRAGTGEIALGDVATKTKDPFFTPALRDNPEAGITGYQTKQMYQDAADAYELRAKAYQDAYAAAAKDPSNEVLGEALTRSGEELDQLLVDLRRREMITKPEAKALIETPALNPDIPQRLRTIAEVRASEVPDLTRRLADEGLDRYVALATGEKMVFHDHIPHLLEVSGLQGYARNERFFDAMASIGIRTDRADIGELRYHSIQSSLQRVADKYGLGTGKKVADDIYDELKVRYDPAYALRTRGEQLSTTGPFVTRETATGRKRELFKIDPRDLRPDDIVTALKLDRVEGIDEPFKVANEIKAAIHEGSAFGASLRGIANPVQLARSLGQSLRISGLPGFNDFMRTANIPLNKLPKALGGERFAKGSYGYLPHNLRRAHMALQFSLSPSFDVSRYVEAMSFGAMKGAIHPKFALMPMRAITKDKQGFMSPYSAEPVFGEEAIRHRNQFGDEVFHGRRPMMQNFDELQLRMQHRGIFGFKPKEVEYNHAFILAQQKLAKGPITNADMEEIRETVLQIHQYGGKQTPAGNSMHFIFFPYLFSQKQLVAMHDFVLGAPLRNLMVHEGFRRWYQVNEAGESASQRFNDRMEKHFPLAKEVERINNLSYGIGPGRFFLEGIIDQKTEGRVAQGLASFFLPGGVHQPVQQATGKAANIVKTLFTPVVLRDVEVDYSGNRVSVADKALDLVEGLAPAYRDMQRWFDEEEGTLRTLATAIDEGATPRAQYTAYEDAKRVLAAKSDAIAEELGYSSWESLRSSPQGAQLREAINEIDLALGEMFPSGAEIADKFTNMDKKRDRILYDILRKPERTPAEEAILAMGEIEDRAMAIAAASDITQDEMGRRIGPMLRSFAVQHVDDRQFASLYEALFGYDYGPIRRIA